MNEAPPLTIDEPGFLEEMDEEAEASPEADEPIPFIDDEREPADLAQLPAFAKPGREKFITTGRDGLYLPVRQRIVWMRGEPQPHPEWLIQTELMQFREGDYQGNKSILLGGEWQDVPDVKGGLAVVQARVLTVLPNGKEGPVIGEGMALERSELFHDFVEKAETAAIGRALAVAGYGTEAALDLDEGANNVADAPVRSVGAGRGGGFVGAAASPGPFGVPMGPVVTPTQINITPSAIPDVRQGGRQSQATAAQIAAIRARAGELMLSPSGLQRIIYDALDDPQDQFFAEDVDDNADGTNLVLGYLTSLSFEDCGKVVLALADPARG